MTGKEAETTMSDTLKCAQARGELDVRARDGCIWLDSLYQWLDKRLEQVESRFDTVVRMINESKAERAVVLNRLEQHELSLNQINKVVRDGNGEPALPVRIAALDARVQAIAADMQEHLAEEQKRREELSENSRTQWSNRWQVWAAVIGVIIQIAFDATVLILAGHGK